MSVRPETGKITSKIGCLNHLNSAIAHVEKATRQIENTLDNLNTKYELMNFRIAAESSNSPRKSASASVIKSRKSLFSFGKTKDLYVGGRKRKHKTRKA
jgi:hypothetical protein